MEPNSKTTDRPSEQSDEGPSRRRIHGVFSRMRGLFRRAGPVEAQALDNAQKDQQLVDNARRLGGLRVDDCMVPRADIVAVDADAGLEDVLTAFREGSHSRIPIYNEVLDDPIGFVHVKDLLLSYGLGGPGAGTPFSLRHHRRRVLTVPPSMPAATLLQRMQAERVHMALVIDEYGGVDGLVTIEDLVEVIVGDIEDEHDEKEVEAWTQRPDGLWVVDARAYLDEFEQVCGVTLRNAESDDDVDTVGGLVYLLCGRVPQRSEIVRHPDGHEFTVVEADARRVKRMLFAPKGAQEAATPALPAGGNVTPMPLGKTAPKAVEAARKTA